MNEKGRREWSTKSTIPWSKQSPSSLGAWWEGGKNAPFTQRTNCFQDRHTVCQAQLRLQQGWRDGGRRFQKDLGTQLTLNDLFLKKKTTKLNWNHIVGSHDNIKVEHAYVYIYLVSLDSLTNPLGPALWQESYFQTNMLRNQVSTQDLNVHPWGSVDWVGLPLGSSKVIWAQTPLPHSEQR